MCPVSVFPDSAALARAAADIFAETLTKREGIVRIGVAGGSTPEAMNALLRQRTDLPWERLEVYFGDDRWVPSDHPQSNAGMTARTLTDHVPARVVHQMVRGESPAADALAYDCLLDGVTLDLLFIGLGEDGHTLSLFPTDLSWQEASGRVIATTAPANWPQRITLTPDYAASAREVVLVAAGAGKRDAVRRLLAEQGSDAETPARAVLRKSQNCRILLDPAAAGEDKGPQ